MARQVGAYNRDKTRLLKIIQKEYPGYDPLVELVRVANHEDATLMERLGANKEVCNYIYSKLRSVEVKGDVDHKLTVIRNVKRFDGTIEPLTIDIEREVMVQQPAPKKSAEEEEIEASAAIDSADSMAIADAMLFEDDE